MAEFRYSYEMISVIQRVTEAEVCVAGKTIAEIGTGILALVAVVKGDEPPQVRAMAQRLLRYRIFADESGRMNQSIADIGGALLIVPQFTLAADTRKGLRPSFSNSADPVEAQQLFDLLLAELKKSEIELQFGQFGANMQVSLTNDGPVTFTLRSD